ncbi:hypothetical protein ACFL35_17585 [Candidatus Riflebacteria bacterium]
MSFFQVFTPVSYWFLVLFWTFILIFYINRLVRGNALKSSFFGILLIILSIDAFRTLFESFYFGLWYTSKMGFISKSFYDYLVRPENVFIPKFVNLVAATLVIIILLRKWLPEEEEEIKKQEIYTKNLELEIIKRKGIEVHKEKLISELKDALTNVKTLKGLLPICAGCKKIRDDKGYWNQIETYIGEHTDVDFSHGMCPDCMQEHYPEIWKEIEEEKNE